MYRIDVTYVVYNNIRCIVLCLITINVQLPVLKLYQKTFCIL